MTITKAEVTTAITQNYSNIAAGYDAGRFSGRSGNFLYERDRRIIRELVDIASPRNLLDVPTGTGRVLDYLHDLPIPITGIDCTDEMLKQAARYSRSIDTLCIGNAAELPFDDNSFDFIVSLRFFHLFTKRQRVPFADEFQRCIRPGGHLLLSMTNGWYAGGLNWCRYRLGRRTVYFEHRGEIKHLFPGWKVRAIRGNFLPKQWALNALPGIGPMFRRATDLFPLNRLCWERFYLLQKP